ncbi:tyrosine/phenylalanine carboxypeptidase domain-containing protein [Candidatus Nanohalobium constans]|uniref:DUF1704 domain-containing protein n=1 Tax=Candidatus Nanohalobium constans TaxID=2565781 RepID=A0A5Q0UGD0_9ARCH|nr:tyrosine/phenylalanine carboxypeptidase domain-containing protein [Candidatus Nanohalobium constans]QGA80667.1 hypothetical protein LC1Nh_0783 [Candidatus Nanohalobium constans]
MQPEEIDQKQEVLKFDQDKIIQELSTAAEKLLEQASWISNINIQNKKQERKRFKKAREKEENFKPNFEYSKTSYDEEKLLELIEQCIEAVKLIEEDNLEKYGAKKLTSQEMQNFFQEIFQELKLYTKLAANIEDEGSWRRYSEEIWSMVGEETVQDSLQKLQELEKEELEENISPEELRDMFEAEVERLGMDYQVELREVSGCFNIPEKETVVVSKGEDSQRMYSEEEARMLTKHELFHAARAYNGFKAGQKSGFPKILGLHTPFYDRAEEGGALYREEATGTAYKNKAFDYHLRLVAAYKISQSENYREDFQEIVEELIELGGSVDRSFYLVARNREALRHHIYKAGRNDWKNIEDKDKMLIGKVNQEWADKLEKEIGGMIKEPEITADKLFNPSI